jgi:CBS domain containing-hemolysin-like protein
VVQEAGGGVYGVLHANAVLDLLVIAGPDAPIRDKVAEPLMVPETRPLSELLRELRSAHVSLAIVVDEYGRMAGVVSIEDVLEEIVGEIADETDPQQLPVRSVGDGEWIADGSVSLADLAAYGIDLASDSDAFNSLGGLVLHLAGRLPNPGESFKADGFRLVVEQVTNNRVAAVRILRTGTAPVGSPDGGGLRRGQAR